MDQFLIDDVIQLIYYYSDIDTVIKGCYINKNMINIMNDKAFWYNYFLKYSLPIDNINRNWIFEFKKRYKAYNEMILHITKIYQESHTFILSYNKFNKLLCDDITINNLVSNFLKRLTKVGWRLPIEITFYKDNSLNLTCPRDDGWMSHWTLLESKQQLEKFVYNILLI